MTAITLRRGDTAKYRVQIVDDDLAGVDLTGAAVAFTVKTAYGGSADDSDAIFQPLHHWIDGGSSYGIEIIDKDDGIIRIIFLPADTLNLPLPWSWVYDLQVEFGTNETYTYDEGTVTMILDITQREVVA